MLPHLSGLWTTALFAELLSISLADVIYRRVGNALVLGCLAWGLGAHTVAFGPIGLVVASGLSMGTLLLTMPLWLSHLCGAADIKLLAALAACAGLFGMCRFCLLTAGCAGAFGLWRMMIDRRLGEPGAVIVALRHPQGALQRARLKQTTVPVAPALSIGLGLALMEKGLW